MGANVFGQRFQLMSFGESHGVALGAVIDGCPAGVIFDEELLRREMGRRRPGQSALTTSRQEADEVEILSGVYEGRTLGTPIAVMVRNRDQRSPDYATIAQQPRPGHADDVWKEKFGHSDPRGGGRSSGRETLSRVIGGALARMFLRQEVPPLHVLGMTSQVGDLLLTEEDRRLLAAQDPASVNVDAHAARFPSLHAARAEEKILAAREAGDSLGGAAEIWITSPPKGLGQPVFHKLKADLAAAMMSVGATSAVEIGAGVEAGAARGQEFHVDAAGDVYGGIRGGIASGETIRVRVSFKPTSSIHDVAKKGRHDPFIVTRAVPVLEAMAWMVMADHVLWARTDRV
ncbi:MAG: chorismate synthase [Bdellovibrionaceae bacterium]|nr:chorismate synthase [Pseudobdellovibrionaceae bacterium]MBX3033002.1 chorismate synthase [Pseudobdellovibrionaceae bacterium]